MTLIGLYTNFGSLIIMQQHSNAMTSCNAEVENLYDCPICLQPFVSPLTLTCGHSFCQTCIKSKHFELTKYVCPMCRHKILVDVQKFEVNVIMEQMLLMRFGKDKVYIERKEMAKRAKMYYRAGFWAEVKRWVREKVPWIIILVLMYHLFKLKLNFFSVKFKDYKDKAISIANSIKVQNSLDFKFLLFSQFMRLLFSTIAIP